ncbi:hypothetical protein [Novosphingobium sediminis]|nr:hypothetical protein [Novosphingobium sediminis]
MKPTAAFTLATAAALVLTSAMGSGANAAASRHMRGLGQHRGLGL